MPRRTREDWIADTRSVDELISVAVVETQLREEEYEQATGAFYALLWRSGPELLQRAKSLTDSPDWMERELGVDLLGQIHDPGFRDVDAHEAWADPSLVHGYLEESMAALLSLVEIESYPDVLDSIAWALGAREDPRGIEPLAQLATHPRAHIRFAATKALADCWVMPEDDAGPAALAEAREIAESVAAPLIVLAGDPDGDIRDWALFGLHQLELDTERIRETFLAHVEDSHHDAMTEALYGLANLGDPRGIEPLRRHLEGGGDSGPVIEACQLYGDQRLVHGLQVLRADEFDDDDDEIDAALRSCQAGLGWHGPSNGVWPAVVG